MASSEVLQPVFIGEHKELLTSQQEQELAQAVDMAHLAANLRTLCTRGGQVTSIAARVSGEDAGWFFARLKAGHLVTLVSYQPKEGLAYIGQIRVENWQQLSGCFDKTVIDEYIARGKQARRRFIESNLRLVRSLAVYYRDQGLDQDDLESEGWFGLIKAVDRFDWTRGCRFSTFASWWIRQALQRALAGQSNLIRLPAYLVERCHKIDRWQERQESAAKNPVNNGRIVIELDDNGGLSDGQVARALAAGNIRVVSLEQPLPNRDDGEDYNLGDIIPASDEPVEEVVNLGLLREVIEEVMNGLVNKKIISPRDNDILRMRFGFDQGEYVSLAEVARKFGISGERARKIEGRVLKLLKRDPRIWTCRDYLAQV